MAAIEEYQAKATQSALDLEEATNERDRAHHRRAILVWKRLIANSIASAEKAGLPVPKAAKRR
ncbi:hypothetical protein BH09PSE4_BH09PSE4_06120 [soil metagenome]